MIKIENIWKNFGSLEVLKGINMELKDKETVAIIGPSGSGKTTLLKCLNYLVRPDKGIITIGNLKIDAENTSKDQVIKLRKKSSMVFQQYNLFKNKTALENIMSGLVIPRGVDKTEAKKIALELLKEVGLEKFADYYPSQLSGGQQQRIGIARALAVNPEVILFDEPTSALDPELVSDVLATIERLSEKDISMIIVTHEIGFAYDVADRVIFMADGIVVEEGTPEKVLKYPEEEKTKHFLKETKKQAQNLFV